MGHYFGQVKAVTEIAHSTGKWVVLVYPSGLDQKEKQMLYDDFVSVGAEYGGVFGRTFRTKGGNVSIAHVRDEIFVPLDQPMLVSMAGWIGPHETKLLEPWLKKATLLTYNQ